MKSLKIIDADISVPALGAGCMRICNLSDDRAVAAWVDGLMERGVNFFDHADIYGRKSPRGYCEKIFGDYLAAHPGSRDRMIIQTKCGIREGFYDFSREHILQSVEESLKRLRTDWIDILLLHRPDALVEPEEVAAAFEQLYRGGKVRAFGVSNHSAAQLELLRSRLTVPLVINQLQFGPAHTLIIDSGLNVNNRTSAGTLYADGILEYCRLHNLLIQAWSPLAFGLFEGIFPADNRYRELNETLARIGARHRLAPLGCTVAWISRHPAGIQTLLGSTRTERFAEAVAGTEVRLSREEWYEIYRAAGNRLP